MERVRDFLTQCLDAIPFICVALAGTLVQVMHGKWPGWRNLIASMSTAGFGALLIGFVTQSLDIPDGITYFLSGMMGYSGGSLVDRLLEATERRVEESIAERVEEHHNEEKRPPTSSV